MFEGAGYLFARTLPSDADAALGQVQFTPREFNSSTVTVVVPVANLGLMPWSGTDVTVTFSLVPAIGVTTLLGSVNAPSALASGELVNVTFTWHVAAGAAGVLRVTLAHNHDANATNDVVIALPCALDFDKKTFAISTPADRSFFVCSLSSTGPAAAPVTVQVSDLS